VTGAGSGSGRELARACARRGARLVICELDENRLAEAERDLRALGCDLLARRVDVGSPAEMERFAADSATGSGIPHSALVAYAVMAEMLRRVGRGKHSFRDGASTQGASPDPTGKMHEQLRQRHP